MTYNLSKTNKEINKMVVYDAKIKKDIEEYISMRFDTSFSLDENKCKYVYDTACIGQGKQPTEILDCVKIKDKYYSLNSGETFLTLQEIEAIAVVKVKNTDMLYAVNNRIIVPIINFSKDFVDFRKTKYIEQHQEIEEL